MDALFSTLEFQAKRTGGQHSSPCERHHLVGWKKLNLLNVGCLRMEKSELFWRIFLLSVTVMVLSGIGSLATNPPVIESTKQIYDRSSKDSVYVYEGIQLLPNGVDPDSDACDLELADTRLTLFGPAALGTMVRFDCTGNPVYKHDSIRVATWDVEADGNWYVESEEPMDEITFEHENPSILNSGHFFTPCCLSSGLTPIAFLAMVISSRLEDKVVLEP